MGNNLYIQCNLYIFMIMVFLSIINYIISYDSIEFGFDSYNYGVAIIWVVGFAIFYLKYKNDIFKSISFIFYVISGVFHLGIPISKIFYDGSSYINNYIDIWYYEEEVFFSLSFVSLFFICYLIPVVLFKKRREKNNLSTIVNLNASVSKVSTLFLIFFIVLWFLAVKLVFDINNYAQYHYMVSSSGFGKFIAVYVNTIIGVSFIISNFNDNLKNIHILVFLIWAVFAFSLGLRGEVLFPLFLSLPFIIERCKGKLNNKVIVSISVLLLIASSVVFNNRGEEKKEATISYNPFSTLSELGGSLRPVSETVNWIDNGEVGFKYGMTYIAPFERALSKFIPFMTVPSASNDERLMNIVMMSKSGPYGYSIVAESYINFDLLGVAIAGFLLGLFFSINDNKPIKGVMFICLSYGFFFHIRQSYVGAFGSVIVFLFTLYSYIIISRLKIKM
ncbi:oligosaccharide repeat unit polymerase [Vibrio alginolyticus]|uniref:O-antigen polymerase n=1 Tax=Vibrio alginolyticus TaxID=663 RepID=UPI001BD4F1F1|nr:O-antigen polymerase [Vibrio alginolyticus]MBS9933704.1 oligosaccharide repeat unit polymerase [Vibrio alginolyticus]